MRLINKTKLKYYTFLQTSHLQSSRSLGMIKVKVSVTCYVQLHSWTAISIPLLKYLLNWLWEEGSIWWWISNMVPIGPICLNSPKDIWLMKQFYLFQALIKERNVPFWDSDSMYVQNWNWNFMKYSCNGTWSNQFFDCILAKFVYLRLWLGSKKWF